MAARENIFLLATWSVPDEVKALAGILGWKRSRTPPRPARTSTVCAARRRPSRVVCWGS